MARFLANLFTPQDREETRAILNAESLRPMTLGTAANEGYACGLAVNRAGNARHIRDLQPLRLHVRFSDLMRMACNYERITIPLVALQWT